jgi:hypothetical protein
MKQTCFVLRVGMIVLALGLSGAWAADDDHEVAALRAENRLLKATVEQRDAQIAALKKEVEALKAESARLRELCEKGAIAPKKAEEPKAEAPLALTAAEINKIDQMIRKGNTSAGLTALQFSEQKRALRDALDEFVGKQVVFSLPLLSVSPLTDAYSLRVVGAQIEFLYRSAEMVKGTDTPKTHMYVRGRISKEEGLKLSAGRKVTVTGKITNLTSRCAAVGGRSGAENESVTISIDLDIEEIK